MHNVVCIVLCALSSIHCIVCILFYALYSMHCIPYIVFHALYSMHWILFIILCTFDSLHTFTKRDRKKKKNSTCILPNLKSWAEQSHAQDFHLKLLSHIIFFVFWGCFLMDIVICKASLQNFIHFCLVLLAGKDMISTFWEGPLLSSIRNIFYLLDFEVPSIEVHPNSDLCTL